MRDAIATEQAPVIRAVGRRLPPHYAPQEQILDALRELWQTRHFNVERLEDLHRAVMVSGRYLALPIEAYLPLESFQQRNDAWLRAAVDLAEDAAREALARAGLEPRDVDHLFFVTVTGVATPSVDARLMNRLGLRPDVRRTPIFGLGCVGGAAGTARAADVLRGSPGEVALLVSVELCSLTLQRVEVTRSGCNPTGGKEGNPDCDSAQNFACYAQVVAEDKLVDQLKNGKSAVFIIFQTEEAGIGIPISLNGFAQALSQLK